MDKRKLFEKVSSKTPNLGIKFNDFKAILEDFEDIMDDRPSGIYLEEMPLVGEYSLLQALNVDVEDLRDTDRDGTQALIAKIQASIPMLGMFFAPSNQNRMKAIDLFKGEVEALKKLLSNLESTLISSITGEEAPVAYKATIPGSEAILSGQTVTQSFITSAIKTFAKPITGDLDPSQMNQNELQSLVDGYVLSQEGLELISKLKGLGMDRNVTSFVDTIFSSMGIISGLEEGNFSGSVMSRFDDIDFEEIDFDTINTRQVNDYVSGMPFKELNDLEMTMDPFVRMGMFYQLCLLQNAEVMDRIEVVLGTDKLSHNEFIRSKEPFKESLTMLFNITNPSDLGQLEMFLPRLNDLSLQMMNVIWNNNDAKKTKRILFIPMMQAFYIAFANFILGEALYKFLTARTSKAKTRRDAATAAAADIAKKAEEERIKTSALPSTMSDVDRGRKIISILKNPKLKELFSDNVIYTTNAKNLDPEKVKALKELVYYLFGGNQSPIISAKTWDITKYPIDGNYDTYFSNIIKEIQTVGSIPPLRGGQGDAKVGPNTKAELKQIASDAIEELLG